MASSEEETLIKVTDFGLSRFVGEELSDEDVVWDPKLSCPGDCQVHGDCRLQQGHRPVFSTSCEHDLECGVVCMCGSCELVGVRACEDHVSLWGLEHVRIM